MRCFCSVRFDIDRGQVLEECYPAEEVQRLRADAPTPWAETLFFSFAGAAFPACQCCHAAAVPGGRDASPCHRCLHFRSYPKMRRTRLPALRCRRRHLGSWVTPCSRFGFARGCFRCPARWSVGMQHRSPHDDLIILCSYVVDPPETSSRCSPRLRWTTSTCSAFVCFVKSVTRPCRVGSSRYHACCIGCCRLCNAHIQPLLVA